MTSPKERSDLKYTFHAPILNDLTSERANDIGVNEADPHSYLLRNPWVVGNWLNAGQPIFLRKEATVGRKRPDLLIWFYGASSYDIVECKWHNEALITKNGELTRSCGNAIARLLKNRKSLMSGQGKVEIAGRTRPIPRPDHLPRAILIGLVPGNLADVHEEARIIDRALESSPWRTYHRQKLLRVTTWRTLDTIDAPPGLFPQPTLRGRSKRLRENYLVRYVLASSFQSQFGEAFNRRTFERSIASHAKSRAAFCGGYSDRFADETVAITERASGIVEKLVDSGLLHGQTVLDAELANALILLADYLFYRKDGDISCGRWEHGGTYPAVKLLENCPEVLEEIIPQLKRVVRLDSSEDAINMATHIARMRPAQFADAWQADDAARTRWSYNSTEQMLKESERPLCIIRLHVAYSLALHGDVTAVEFLNACGRDPLIVQTLALWNRIHSLRKPNALIESIYAKVVSKKPELVRLRAYHKAVLDATTEARKLKLEM